jgi:lipopolysaccharide biosynthesis regulator YciM
LHKVLGIYTETHEWRRAVEIIDRLAEIEREPAVRAKLHYTARSSPATSWPRPTRR